MPPPTTSMRFGIVGELERAGRIDDARSSYGTNGSCTDCEPAAMIALLEADDRLRAGRRLPGAFVSSTST